HPTGKYLYLIFLPIRYFRFFHRFSLCSAVNPVPTSNSTPKNGSSLSQHRTTSVPSVPEFDFPALWLDRLVYPVSSVVASLSLCISSVVSITSASLSVNRFTFRSHSCFSVLRFSL